jgi:plasmid maintenance system antidote protein VapI
VKRTRKWTFVAQEATRLAALGLSPKDIATRLNVDKSSVTRWIKQGRLAITRNDRKPVRIAAAKKTTPEQWAIAVRAAYDLDATDEQLVSLAVDALKMSRDLAIGPQARMTAAGRFQALVKQLRLVARAEAAPAATPEAPKRQTFAPQRRSNADPRTLLTAVK